MIIDNEKKIQEMSGGMDVDSPVKNAQTGAAAATVEETAAGPADADGAREAAPPVNVEEGWRRQGRQRPQIETVEAKVMMYGRFSVQIEGPRDGVTVQAIWSELVRDQSMELMADWKPTWYAPGVQKQCSKFMQLQETPFVKLLAKAGAGVAAAIQRESEVRSSGASTARRAECSAETDRADAHTTGAGRRQHNTSSGRGSQAGRRH